MSETLQEFYDKQSPPPTEREEYSQQFRLEHKAEKREYDKQYRQVNKKRIRAYARRYRKVHPETVRLYEERHRAQILERKKKYHSAHHEEEREKSRIYRVTHASQIKRYRETHREEIREYHRRHFQDVRVKHMMQGRVWALAHPYEAFVRTAKQLARNGNYIMIEISREEFTRLRGIKNCQICGRLENGKKLAIDHDHKTGKLRGVLCSNCNLIIGYAGDNIELLKKVIAFLEGAQET